MTSTPSPDEFEPPPAPRSPAVGRYYGKSGEYEVPADASGLLPQPEPAEMPPALDQLLDAEPEPEWTRIPTGLETPPDTSHLLPAVYAPPGQAELVASADAEPLALELRADEARLRAGRLKYLTAIGAAATLFALGIGAGVASSGGAGAGIGVGTTIFLIFAVTMFVVLRSIRNRRTLDPMPNALASAGPHSHGAVHSTADAEAIIREIEQSVSYVGYQVEQLEPNRWQIDRPAGPSRPPYKLLIDIRPAPDRPGSQLVSVLSRPVSAMPYPDGDSVQQLADSVLRAVPGRTDTNPTDHFTSD